MSFGIVVGTVVSSQMNNNIDGGRYLLVEKCNQYGKKKSDFIVALDLVSAGKDEMVMISESSAARETKTTNNKPLDAIIIGIIDLIDENNQIVYRK